MHIAYFTLLNGAPYYSVVLYSREVHKYGVLNAVVAQAKYMVQTVGQKSLGTY
jgi:hypothetical protein